MHDQLRSDMHGIVSPRLRIHVMQVIALCGDIMGSAAHSYNLSVVMVRSIPWYRFIRRSSDAGIILENEQSCGASDRTTVDFSGHSKGPLQRTIFQQGDQPIYLCSRCHEPSQSAGGGSCFRQLMRFANAVEGRSPGTTSSAAANEFRAWSQRRSR